MDIAIVSHLAKNFGSGHNFISQFWVVMIPTKEGIRVRVRVSPNPNPNPNPEVLIPTKEGIASSECMQLPIIVKPKL